MIEQNTAVLTERCADLEAEVERLEGLVAQKLIDSTAISQFRSSKGRTAVELSGVVAQILASSFGQMLYEGKAENYVEMSFESEPHAHLGSIVVTIKREAGKSPHQLRVEAEIERDQLRERLQRLVS